MTDKEALYLYRMKQAEEQLFIADSREITPETGVPLRQNVAGISGTTKVFNVTALLSQDRIP